MKVPTPTHIHTANEAWFRLAIVETLVGGLLGLITAFVLVVLSLKVFPGLADFDHDLGLRMRNAFYEQKAYWSYGQVSAKAEEPAPLFVFLDIDPEPSLHVQANEAPQAACRALELASLACRRPNGPTPERASGPQCVGSAEALDCAPDKPANRELLASLIAALRDRGARMIVLDVELGDAASPLPGSAALREVLWPSAGASVPLVYATPARYDRAGNGFYLVRPEPPWGPANASSSPGGIVDGMTLPAIALPAPGQPIRRYPRCYQSTRHADGIVPSLPWLAAWVLKNGTSQASSACMPGTTPDGKPFDPLNTPVPYIDFAVPALTEHLDQADDSPEFGRSEVFRDIAVRCLASEFWSWKAKCGLARTYEGTVVVIGASHAHRRDNHSTPIGSMVGAEVIINATRTFAVTPHSTDKSLGAALFKKTEIVLLCMIPWLLYFSLRGYLLLALQRGSHVGNEASNAVKSSLVRRLAILLVSATAFFATLVTVVVITVQSSIASFSVLVSVLAVGVEQYFEATKWALHFCGNLFRRMLRLPPEPGGH